MMFCNIQITAIGATLLLCIENIFSGRLTCTTLRDDDDELFLCLVD